MKVFINRDDLDFSSATDVAAIQTLTLSQAGDVQDVPVKRNLFGNVYSLTLFVMDNYGAGATNIFYLGFKGEFTKLAREPVEVLYEKAANPKDHAPIVGINDMAAQGPGHGM